MRISSPLNDCFKRVHNFTLAGSKSMNSCSPCSMVIKVFRWNETDASAVVHCPNSCSEKLPSFFWIYMSFMRKLSFASCDPTWCFNVLHPVLPMLIMWALYGLKIVAPLKMIKYMSYNFLRGTFPTPVAKLPAWIPSTMKMQNNFTFRHFWKRTVE